ncbi:MAG: HdeD family acid-resistance protein [Afipia sp.]
MATATMQPQQSSIWWVFLLQGIAGILLGLMLLTAPAATLVTLVTFLGFYWIVSGVLSLVQMFVDRSVPWIWSLLIGLVSVAAGVLVVKHPLVAALTVPTIIVLVFGIEGIVIGILELIGGFSGGGVGSFIRGIFNLLIGILLLSAPMAAALAVPLVFGILLLLQGGALIALAFRARS